MVSNVISGHDAQLAFSRSTKPASRVAQGRVETNLFTWSLIQRTKYPFTRLSVQPFSRSTNDYAAVNPRSSARLPAQLPCVYACSGYVSVRVSSIRSLVTSEVVRLLSVYLSFGSKTLGRRQPPSRPSVPRYVGPPALGPSVRHTLATRSL